MEEPPELVKTMLEFMSKGVIPEDIDDKAMDLILMSDMYGLDLGLSRNTKSLRKKMCSKLNLNRWKK